MASKRSPPKARRSGGAAKSSAAKAGRPGRLEKPAAKAKRAVRPAGQSTGGASASDKSTGTPKRNPKKTKPRRKPSEKLADKRRASSPAAAPATAALRSATDRQLLALLQADGRASNLALAKAVGLSPAACHDRVRKLLAQGLIRNFGGHLDAGALGSGLVVFATVQLDRSENRVVDVLRKTVAANSAFMECHLVAGGADVLLKIRTHDLPSYQRLLDELIFPIRGVRAVNSHTCMQTIKETCAIPL